MLIKALSCEAKQVEAEVDLLNSLVALINTYSMKATVLACVLVLGSHIAHGVPLPRLLTLNGGPSIADATVLETATDEKPWVSLHCGQPT